MKIKFKKTNAKSLLKKSAALFILPLFSIYSFSAYGDCSTHGQACESSPVSDCHGHDKKLKSPKIKKASQHDHGSHKHGHSHKTTSVQVETKEGTPKVNQNAKACGCENPTLAATQGQSLEKDTKQSKTSGITLEGLSDLSIASKYRLLKIPISNGRSSPLFILQEKLLI